MMRSFSIDHAPRYTPHIGDLIKVRLENISANEFYTRVLSSETHVLRSKGSARKGKIRLQLVCQTGTGDVPVQLIWKAATGWVCWINGQQFNHVTVGPS